ncbi:hypothetical protein GQR58_026142 [Nymphon striatum]|nr:hypothetical protein GQR58_026142 [Nymphon striatum]
MKYLLTLVAHKNNFSIIDYHGPRKMSKQRENILSGTVIVCKVLSSFLNPNNSGSKLSVSGPGLLPYAGL